MKKYRELLELKGLLREKKINYETLAKYLKMSLSALSNKINGKSIFNILEVDKIASFVGIKKEDIPIYFFWLFSRETQKNKHSTITGGKEMKYKNKELSKDNSLRYFIRLLLIVFTIILFSVGIILLTIRLISWFIYFLCYEIN